MPLLSILFSVNIGFANAVSSDTAMIKAHLAFLTQGPGYRNVNNPDRLNATAVYIHAYFELYADTVFYQEFMVDGQVFKNVVASFGVDKEKRVIVGAHYDVCGNQAGADDNGSGVTGLLELARMLNNKHLQYRIDLVAYTLEEPPYFRTTFMGSYMHAKTVTGEKVYGMISLEMIGYFTDAKNTQHYPLKPLNVFYGTRGNYITVVRKISGGRFAKQFARAFKKLAKIRVKKFSGPERLPGIDFSDHANYWKFGISAVMITDTAFYRNPHYHEPTDQVHTLDINRMAQVIDGVCETLMNLK